MCYDLVGDAARTIKESVVTEQKQIEEEFSSTINVTERFVAVLAIGAIMIGVLLAWLIGRSISAPTRAIGAVLMELANGNKAVDVPYADRGDEVGDNARAAKTFKENLLRIEKMEAEQKGGRGNCRSREALRRGARGGGAEGGRGEGHGGSQGGDVHKLADEFEKAVGNIVETVSSALMLSGSRMWSATVAVSTREYTPGSSPRPGDGPVRPVWCGPGSDRCPRSSPAGR